MNKTLEKLVTQKDLTAHNLKNDMLDLLKSQLNTPVRLEKASPHLLIYYVDVRKKLDIKIKEFLIIFLGGLKESSNKVLSDHISAIQSIIFQESLVRAVNLIFYVNTDPSVQDQYNTCLEENFIFKQSNELHSILASEASKKIITLLSKKSNTVTSPFKYLGPVSPEFFVGRDDVINDIIDGDHTGFAITGGRRIGKTSLLFKIQSDIANGRVSKSYIENEIRTSSYECCYIDCINLYTFQDVYNEIKRKMNPRFIFNSSPNNIKEIINRSCALRNKKLLLLLDEMDDLMAMTSSGKKDAIAFSRDLQAAGKQLKFVITGFRNISDIITNSRHPFYNLCKGMYLRAFSEKSVSKLITLVRLKTDIRMSYIKDVITRIYKHSGGYPSVVQFIFDQLIRHPEGQLIKPEIIEEIVENKATRDFVRETVIMNTNLVERLICILAADSAQITENEIITKLKKQKIQFKDSQKTIYLALKNICNNCIMYEDDHQTFRFLNPIIPRLLNKEMRNLIPQLIEEINHA
jgi:hypothetical protein